MTMQRVRHARCSGFLYYTIETPGGAVNKDRRGRTAYTPEKCPVCDEVIWPLESGDLYDPSAEFVEEGMSQVEEAVVRARWKEDV